MDNIVIGLDIGHSATKLTFDTAAGIRRSIFPSLACPWFQIASPNESEFAEKESVVINGKKYFVGNTARHQGKAAVSTGLNDRWIESDEYAAMVSMAKRIVDNSIDAGVKQFWVVGLPVGQFAKDRQRIGAIVSSIVGDSARVIVVQQPDAAYYVHIYDRSGMIKDKVSPEDESWAVVDVGYFTTDFILYENGHYIEHCSGRYSGVRVAAERIQRALEEQGIVRQLIDVERSLVSGKIRHMGTDLDVSKLIQDAFARLFAEIFDEANRLLGTRVELINGVLVAGGSAVRLSEQMKLVWPHTVVLQDEHHEPNGDLHGPRFIISEGYYRYGKSKLLLERLKTGVK